MQSVRERFEQRAASRPLSLNPELTDHGLCLGAGTVVLAAGDDGNPSDGRLAALLGVAYKRSFKPDVTANLRKAASQWARGDKALARVHVAFAHLPPLARREDAFELFWADELMRAGTAPSALLKVIDLNPDLLDLRKFNRDQPRVPAGNGRESGRWGSGGGDTSHSDNTSHLVTGRSAATTAPDKDQRTRNLVAIIAQKYVGSMNWADAVENGNFPSGKNKCNEFVADVLTAAGASPGEPNHGGWPYYTPYPPAAGQWADPNYNIPGWDVLGPDEHPQPGDVVAQKINYQGGATGHVMIVGPDDSVIGTSDSIAGYEGIIRRISTPEALGPKDLVGGPLVYRRWHTQ